MLATMITEQQKKVAKMRVGSLLGSDEDWRIFQSNLKHLSVGGRVLSTEGGCRMGVELCNTRCGNPKTVGVLLVCYSTCPPPPVVFQGIPA